MLRSLNRYIKNNDFSINIWDNYVHINNFQDIISLHDDCIVLSYIKGVIKVNGNNILIKKLLNNEILLCGDIKNIIMGD